MTVDRVVIVNNIYVKKKKEREKEMARRGSSMEYKQK